MGSFSANATPGANTMTIPYPAARTGTRAAHALSRPRVIRASVLLVAGTLSVGISLAQDTVPLALDFEATSSSFDLQANRIEIEGLRSMQNGVSIEADHALVSDVDTDQEEWRLTGNVRITAVTGSVSADEAVAGALDAEYNEWRLIGNVRMATTDAMLAADSAVFSFEARRLVRAELSGEPASFEQTDAVRGRTVSGGANRLEYDERDRIVRMYDGAWLTDGPNQFRACDLTYDFERERVVTGSSECGEPVRIRMPRPAGDDGTGTQ
jgi:lipopolysaccharide transport protein LptA